METEPVEIWFRPQFDHCSSHVRCVSAVFGAFHKMHSGSFFKMFTMVVSNRLELSQIQIEGSSSLLGCEHTKNCLVHTLVFHIVQLHLSTGVTKIVSRTSGLGVRSLPPRHHMQGPWVACPAWVPLNPERCFRCRLRSPDQIVDLPLRPTNKDLQGNMC